MALGGSGPLDSHDFNVLQLDPLGELVFFSQEGKLTIKSIIVSGSPIRWDR